ncbi:protein-L-isoaspartate(D-aspartate) O-methyltransferase [Chitinasiproducens palmae]|uniref:Protein-L-isoaspartate O-methyltransferase n=1 Tax=Chitinasiproducens palmae TaxID=1770053 RepID=A0A1H2PVS4_9BURK|nr:protein-L-isoaspartate(D-aspartate) O-methyltransferase [Chitinasiproducens palmae]SDV51429.1 protein-L-isoaspartate(D-aspartate) O-methyltransferase [Chitinasiproducens palmae]
MTQPRGKRFPLALSDVMTKGTAPGAAARRPQPLRSAAPASVVRAAESVARAAAVGLASRPQPLGGAGAANGAGAAHEGLMNRMVERLRTAGIRDELVLDALRAVPRHGFVDSALGAQAYEDAALPIGQQQTISKPSVVARMLALASGGRRIGRALEIGTGCGYQAAVLSHLADDVYSVERLKWLHERAKRNLRPLRRVNIRLHYGDGHLGLPIAAPFDAIVIAAAALDVPTALIEQLAVGGRLVAPVGEHVQHLILVEKTSAAHWRETLLDPVNFVPMKFGVS